MKKVEKSYFVLDKGGDQIALLDVHTTIDLAVELLESLTNTIQEQMAETQNLHRGLCGCQTCNEKHAIIHGKVDSLEWALGKIQEMKKTIESLNKE